MDLHVNGQVTLGAAKFWRVDDFDEMAAPDYDPIVLLQQPPMLVNTKQFPDRAALQELLGAFCQRRQNGSSGAGDGATSRG